MNPNSTLPLYARGHVGRVAPIPLRIALTELDESAPPGLADEAWCAAGVACAIAEAFDEARTIGGRAIVDVTFALHTRLGLSATAPATPFIQLVSLDPYMEWLEPRMKDGLPWRPVVACWIETLNERLTMHRYPIDKHRQLHAYDLIAAPLLVLVETESDALFDFVDRAIAFYDLFTAELYAQRGWNRIHLPSVDKLGGFYGLADEARPPTPAHIREMAAALAAQLQPLPAISPELDPCLNQLCSLMRHALESFSTTGQWPDWMSDQTNWFDRLRAWLSRRS